MRQHSDIVLASTILISILVSQQTRADNALSASLGSTGIGLEWITRLNDGLNARFLLTSIGIDTDIEEDDIEYRAEWSSTNFGALLDWHPFPSGFRISGGLVSTNFGIDLKSESSQQQYSVGETTYTGSFDLRGELEYTHVAPYVSIGWSSDLKEKGAYFSGEFGAIVIGDPRLAVSASGTAVSPDVNGGNPIDVGSNPDFQSDLEIERQNLLDELSDFTVYPVVTLGFGFRY